MQDSLNQNIKGKKIGIPSEFFREGLDEDVKKAVYDALKVFEENGAEVKEISLPLSDYAICILLFSSLC